MNESTVTTASFPIKKVAYRNSTAAAQAAAGEQHVENNSNIVHRTSGSINVSSSTRISSKQAAVNSGTQERSNSATPPITASQHERHLQQRQRELAKKKAEARKVALATAAYCSTGVITTFSDFSDGKNNNETKNRNSVIGARKSKVKPKSSPKRKSKKKRASTASNNVVERTTSNGVTTHHEQQEEKISEDDEYESGSHISHTITTTATSNGDHILPSISEEGGVINKEGGGKKFTQRLLAPLLKNETEDDHQSASLTAYQKHQEQLAQEAQELVSSGDVWMCSLCGTPFDSLENADSHELHCVVHWIRPPSR